MDDEDKKPITSRADPESRRAYTRWHYRQNKEIYKKRSRYKNKETRLKSKEYVRLYLEEHPCVDCGETDPIVIEFDHRDRSTKLWDVSTAARRLCSLKRLKEEIEKCDVRCANCHRRKTWLENKNLYGKKPVAE